MKLKNNNAANKSETPIKNKSPKKQGKGVVEARKGKSKDVVKPSVLKKEGKKAKPEEAALSPEKTLQRELWFKAIDNVSNKTNLSDEESSIAKLLSTYKKKSSVPIKRSKLKNFITKGFNKYKDTSDGTFDGLYDKLTEEFKAVGGSDEMMAGETKSERKEKKIVKTKVVNEKASDDEEMAIGDEEDDVEDEGDDDDDNDDDAEDILMGNSDDDGEESEEEKPKPTIAKKGNNKNGKKISDNAKNGSKFKGGKVQKNKKFGKKK